MVHADWSGSMTYCDVRHCSHVSTSVEKDSDRPHESRDISKSTGASETPCIVESAQGSGCRVHGAGFRVEGAGFSVQGAGFRVQRSGCRVQGAGFREQGSGCRVQG